MEERQQENGRVYEKQGTGEEKWMGKAESKTEHKGGKKWDK